MDASVNEGAAEGFRGLILLLRGRTGLTQRELAARVGVHGHSVQGWEAGLSYPGAASLRRLLEVALDAGGFAAGRETAEAEALWAAAAREAPRLRTPFDRAWFDDVLAAWRTRPPGAAPLGAAPAGSGRQHWGEAPDVAAFRGRAAERGRLGAWLREDDCRVVAVLGLGGVGKTLLAARVAHDLAPDVECVYWRSLRDAPPPAEWLAGALGVLAPDRPAAAGDAGLLERLLERLGAVRCLLALDNLETVLEPGARRVAYRAGYEEYGRVLEALAESPHRGRLLLTSREEPPELGPRSGEGGRVRSLALGGLAAADAQAILGEKRLTGDAADWAALVERYGGNGLALKVVGEAVRALFGGDIAAFLAYAATTDGGVFGGVRQLLDAQMDRLSDLERRLLRWLAVERQPVPLIALAADLEPVAGRGAVLEALDGLRRRSLLEWGEHRAAFTPQSVVLEHVTERLVEEARAELASGALERLLEQPLVKATAPDHVRRSQERLLATPVLEHLVAVSGNASAAEWRLVTLLDHLRGRPLPEQGYGPGNMVNLLRLSRGNLNGLDLSGLALRQVYLAEVEARDASLAGADLAEAVLAEPFCVPTSMALSADGAFLASGMSSGEVYVWRLANRALVTSAKEHAGLVRGVVLGDDGGLAATAGHDGTVKRWEDDQPRALVTLQAGLGRTLGVALTADGRLAATGGQDGTINLRDTTDGRLVRVLRGHSGLILGLGLSPDGRLAASGSEDGAVRLWDTTSGQLVKTLPAHTAGVNGVALSADGRVLLSGSADGTARLWEVETGQPLATLPGHASGVWCVALNRDARLAATGSWDGRVRLWEARSGQLLATFQGRTSEVDCVALSGDGRLAASGSQEGNVRLWDIASGELLMTLRASGSGVWGVALSADGRLAASGGFDGVIRLWDTASGRLTTTLHGHTRLVWGVALSRDGRLVASSSYDGTVRLWESATGRPLTTMRGHAGIVNGVALSGDGRRVVSGGYDGTVKLWAGDEGAEDGRLLATLEGHTAGVNGVASSADGQLVASSSWDRTIRLWASSGEGIPTTLEGHTGAVRGVALSWDGRLAASGSWDGTVRLWDTTSGRLRATLEGHTDAVRGVAISGDGRIVVSGSYDGTLRVWEVDSGACLRTMRSDRCYERMDVTGLTGVTEAQRQALFALGAAVRPVGSPAAGLAGP